MGLQGKDAGTTTAGMVPISTIHAMTVTNDRFN